MEKTGVAIALGKQTNKKNMVKRITKMLCVSCIPMCQDVLRLWKFQFKGNFCHELSSIFVFPVTSLLLQ